MKFAKMAILAATLAATPIALHAQQVAAGATVYGNDGNPIGTVADVANGIAIVDTGKHKAPIPAELIGDGEAGPTVNATQAQVNAMMDQQVAEAMAKRDAALTAGAPVLSANGNPAGTLTEVSLEEDAIVLETESGPLALKKEHFAVDNNGQLVALFTREQLTSAAASARAGTSGGASQ